MRLLDRLRRCSADDLYDNSATGQTEAITSRVLSMYGKSPGKIDTSKAAMLKRNFGTVYVCSSINAELVASQPLRLFRDDEKHEEVLDSPILDLLATPNAQTTGYDLMVVTQKHLDLMGCAYWYVVRNSLGVPSELWPLQAQLVTVEYNKRAEVVKVTVQNPGQDTVYEPDEVIIFLYPDPANIFAGRGCLASVVEDADIEAAMIRHNRMLIENGTSLGGIVTLDPMMSAEERKRLEDRWKIRHRGPNRPGGWEFIFGDSKVLEMGRTPKELGFHLTGPLVERRIARAFDVPESWLKGDSVNRANAREGHIQYAKQGLRPRLRRIEEVLNTRLLPMFGGQPVVLEYDDPVPEDVEFRVKRNVAYVKARIFTPNEAREEEGKEALEGADELQRAGGGPGFQREELSASKSLPDVSLKPYPNEHACRVREPDVFQDGTIVRLNRKDDKGRRYGLILGRLKNETTLSLQAIRYHKDDWSAAEARAACKKHHGRFEAAAGKVVECPECKDGEEPVKDAPERLAIRLDKFFDGQEKRVLAVLRRSERAAPIEPAVPLEGALLVERAVKEVAVKQAELERVLGDGYEEFIKSQGAVAADSLSADWGARVRFDAYNARIQQTVKNHVIKLAPALNRWTGYRLRKTLMQGIADNELMPDLVKRVERVMGKEATRPRARMIARTEFARAHNAARAEMFQQTKVVVAKKWLAFPGHCAWCAEFNGKTISLEETFVAVGETIESTDEKGERHERVVTYSDIDEPPLHPNCRCTVVAEVDEELLEEFRQENPL